MTIRFQCPAGHRLRAPDDRAGRKVRCPRCQQAVEVPQPAEQTPAEPAATIPPPVADRPSKRPPVLPKKSGAKPEPAVLRPAEPVSVPAPEPVEAVGCVPVESSRKSSLPPASLPPVVPVDVPSPEPVPPVEPVEAPADLSLPTPVEKKPAKTETKRGPSRHVGRRDRKRHKRESEPAVQSATAEPAAAPSGTDREPAKPLRPARSRARPKPPTMPPDVYVPDVGHVAAVRWLALFLGLAVAFSLCPVVYKSQLNLATAEWWARIALLLAAVQVAFIVWMVNRPDWASVWVVMLVFAAVATLYGTCTAIALATPVHKPILLGMAEVRESAKTWCGSVLLVMSLVTYLSGRTSVRWRRALELQRSAAKRTR